MTYLRPSLFFQCKQNVFFLDSSGSIHLINPFQNDKKHGQMVEYYSLKTNKLNKTFQKTILKKEGIFLNNSELEIFSSAIHMFI